MLIFLCSGILALLLQLVVLPYLFTGLHAGEGLLIGGDWIEFHRDAASLAQKIQTQGWAAWELRPQRQAPAGIAAVFYVLVAPHPWVLVPLNAALHATAGLVLVRIMQSFVPDPMHALVCALPFLAFPSAMTWYAQIHKDGYYFTGFFLSLYGWVLVARLETWQGRLTQVLSALGWILAGCLLIWIVRPYGIKLMQGIGVIFAILLIPLFLVRAARLTMGVPRVIMAVVLVLALQPALGVFRDTTASGEVTVVTRTMLDEAYAREKSGPDDDTLVQEGGSPGPSGSPRPKVGSFAQKAAFFDRSVRWQKTDWLPEAVDNIFFTLALVRTGYSGSPGKSNIDADIQFHGATEFISYLPRALQVGFAAPFPTLWFAQGSNEATSVMRRISALEMLGIYSALLFLPYAIWHWRKKVETWLVTIACVVLLLIYTYIIPNVGSLYRARYGFLMVLVALGIAGGMAAWQRLCSRPRG